MDMSFEQMVRERAYEIWVAAGRQDGMAAEHWCAAEADVKTTAAAAPRAPTVVEAAAPKAAAKPRTKTPAKATAPKKTAKSAAKPVSKAAARAAKAEHGAAHLN